MRYERRERGNKKEEKRGIELKKKTREREIDRRGVLGRSDAALRAPTGFAVLLFQRRTHTFSK